VAAAIVVVAALVLGAAVIAVTGSGVVTSEAVHLLIAIAVIVAGLLVARPADELFHPRAAVLGYRVLTGIGAAAVVVGSYLIGITLLELLTPDLPTLSNPGPSLLVAILLLYGAPLIGLIGLAANGNRAGAVGAGLVAPVLLTVVLAERGATAAWVSVVLLVVAVLLLVVSARTESETGRSFATVGGALAASFAAGAGTSPFGALTSSAGFDPGRSPTGTLSPGLSGVVLALTLAVAAVLLIMSVRRGEFAGGFVAASVFAVPPQALLGADGAPVPSRIALIVIPVLVAGIAGLALRVPEARAAVTRTLGLEEPVGDAALLGAIGCAAVVFAVQVVPVLAWPSRLAGAVVLLVLAGSVALALRLADRAGAVLAGVSLVALQLSPPWYRLINGDSPSPNLTLTAIVGLVIAVAAVWLLVRRHPRPGVLASAAYLLLGALAAFLYAVLSTVYRTVDREVSFFSNSWAPALMVLLPLLPVGIPAAIAALRGTETSAAGGQAAGCVVLLAAAFIPIRLLATTASDAAERPAQLALGPLTPTDVSQASRFIGGLTGLVVTGVLLMILVGLALAVSLIRRASTALTAAVVLFMTVAAQTLVLGTLDSKGVAASDRLVWTVVAVAGVLVVIAIASTLIAERRARRAS
jgi:hypothetical protein